jgi:hypothetical protein
MITGMLLVYFECDNLEVAHSGARVCHGTHSKHPIIVNGSAHAIPIFRPVKIPGRGVSDYAGRNRDSRYRPCSCCLR